MSEVRLRRLLHFHENERADLRGRVALPVRLHPRVAVRRALNLERDYFPDEAKRTVADELKTHYKVETFNT